MLRERVITALVLLALLIPAVMARSPLPFALLTIILISAAGWEWARLCGLPRVAAIASGVLLGLACAAIAPLGGGIGGVEFSGEAWGIVAVLWMFTSVVFVAFYTATLTASLTVQQFRSSTHAANATNLLHN